MVRGDSALSPPRPGSDPVRECVFCFTFSMATTPTVHVVLGTDCSVPPGHWKGGCRDPSWPSPGPFPASPSLPWCPGSITLIWSLDVLLAERTRLLPLISQRRARCLRQVNAAGLNGAEPTLTALCCHICFHDNTGRDNVQGSPASIFHVGSCCVTWKGLNIRGGSSQEEIGSSEQV